MPCKVKIASVNGDYFIEFDSLSECKESLEIWRDALRRPDTSIVNNPMSVWRANNIIGVMIEQE